MIEISTDESIRRAYARDASGVERIPEGVARPASAADVVEILQYASGTKVPITPAGAQTGYVAGSITDAGIVLALRGMDSIIDLDPVRRTVRVQPGAILGDVKRAVAAEGFLLAVDPTSENECSIGGAIAANASGARSLKYGATRRHVTALSVVLASGDRADLNRVAMEKNTAGLFPAQNPIDWFIGSEGTLGVIVEAELALQPLPALVTGFAFPFGSMTDAARFIIAARESSVIAPRCLEFLDEAAFGIAAAALGEEGWSVGSAALVYAEEEAFGDAEVSVDAWLKVAESCDARVDGARVFTSESELREARRMRHAVPAALNDRGARYRAEGGRKVSTDWAVPYHRLGEALEISGRHADAHGIARPVTFGHAGNGHPHQHFLGRNPEELLAIENVIAATLRDVVAMGGTVSAEHGIGKLKKHWLALQLSPLQLQLMKSVKHNLDPLDILAPGNLF